MNVNKLVTDGFKNIMKGLGTSKDPRESQVYQKGVKITQSIANDLYVYNWIAAKGVDIPVDDATRKWRSLLIPDADKKKEIEDIMTGLDVKGKISLAMKWARVFGGSAIVIIIEGDDLAEELVIENIKPGTLKNFIVLDRYNIYPSNIDRDILSSNFGKPSYYTVSREGQYIHHSRVIRFDGVVHTIMEAEQNNFWGVSIFTKTWDAISDVGTISQSVINLVYESNVDVFRINGLNSLVAEGKDSVVTSRLRLASEMKSIINGIAIDKDDEYHNKTSTFTNLPEIYESYMQNASGGFDIPLTRFLGVSPSGLNATGAADLLNYYDNVGSMQENVIRPALDIIDPIVMASSFSKNETFEYEFHPLQQLSETEQADVDVKNKDRDIAYIDAGVITELDVIAQLAESGTYVTIDENRVEEEKKLEELEFEQEEEENQNSISGEEPEGVGEAVSKGTE